MITLQEHFDALRQHIIDQSVTIVCLRSLLHEWERRVVCPQCGQRYQERACGPTHAEVFALVYPNEGEECGERAGEQHKSLP